MAGVAISPQLLSLVVLVVGLFASVQLFNFYAFIFPHLCATFLWAPWTLGTPLILLSLLIYFRNNNK